MAKRIVRLTESDLNRIVRRVINEGKSEYEKYKKHIEKYDDILKNEYTDYEEVLDELNILMDGIETSNKLTKKEIKNLTKDVEVYINNIMSALNGE